MRLSKARVLKRHRAEGLDDRFPDNPGWYNRSLASGARVESF
jgi:hypothetical protein